MAKVIKYPEPNKPITTSCFCGAVVEFNFSDIVKSIDDQREGAADACKCPVCNRMVWLYRNRTGWRG